MKKIILVFVILFIGVHSLSAQTEDSRDLYQKKIKTYTKVRNTGNTLAIVGGSIAIVGLGFLYDYEYVNNSSNLGSLVLGSSLAISGNNLGMVGIGLIVFGALKRKQYQKKIDGLSLGLNFSPNQTAVSIKYRF